jgi:hypothetical protein
MRTRWSDSALCFFDVCGFDLDYLSTAPPPVVAALEAAAERFHMKPARYTVQRNGRTCCDSDNLEHLCGDCRRQAKEVPAPPSLLAALQERRGTTPEAPQIALAANGVPTPPRLADHIRQLRVVSTTHHTGGRR